MGSPVQQDADDEGVREGEAKADAHADAEAAFKATVEQDLRRNYAPYLIHGMLGQTGFRIIQAPTFLPMYIFSLAGENWLVGVARSCQALGMFLTPLLGASLIEHRRRVMGMVFATGIMMRLQVLGLALAGFFLGVHANRYAVCLFLGLFGLFTGMQSVTFSFLMSKLIPVERRGSLVGFRNALAGLTAAFVAGVGGYMIDAEVLGNGYASTFLLSFVLTAAGLCMLLIVREPETPNPKVEVPLRERMRDLPALVRDDSDYRMYLVARALGVSGRMALPFFILWAVQRTELSDTDLGTLTAIFVLGNTLTNLLWGLLADRRGFRLVLLCALLIWIASTVVFIFGDSYLAFAIGYVGIGAGFGGFQMACINLVLEFGKREDLPMRIAVAQSAEQGVGVVAPLVGGLVAEVYGYGPLFWLTAAVQVLALGVVVFGMRDPRHRELAVA